MVPVLADRLIGSPDAVWRHARASRRRASTSSPATTASRCSDLVSYNRKHNEANGEDNRDGSDDNLSWNCGVEGPTDDPQVLALRTRQVKNLLAINLLSLGTPMLLMGDEMRRTPAGQQQRLLPGQRDQLARLDAARAPRRDPPLRARPDPRCATCASRCSVDHHLTLAELMARVKVQLHGVRLRSPDTSAESHSLAITASSLSGDLLMHFALNAWWEPLDFELPPLPGWADSGWRRIIDTAQPSPHDLVAFEQAPPVAGATHRVQSRSVVVLFAAARQRGADAGTVAA